MDLDDNLLRKSAGSFKYIFRVNLEWNKDVEFFLDSAKEKVFLF